MGINETINNRESSFHEKYNRVMKNSYWRDHGETYVNVSDAFDDTDNIYLLYRSFELFSVDDILDAAEAFGCKWFKLNDGTSRQHFQDIKTFYKLLLEYNYYGEGENICYIDDHWPRIRAYDYESKSTYDIEYIKEHFLEFPIFMIRKFILYKVNVNSEDFDRLFEAL